VPIKHDQVDFTTAAAKITCNGTQALVQEEFVGELLGAVA